MTEHITKFATTVKWLYTKGRAKRIAFPLKGRIVEYAKPVEFKFLFALLHIFDLSDLDQIHITWLVWDEHRHTEVERDVLFFRDGHAILSLDGNPVAA